MSPLPAAPKVLSSGYSVQKKEEKLYIINHHTGSLYIMLFIFALIGAITSMNAIIVPIFIYNEGDNPLLPGTIILGGALLIWYFFSLVRKAIKRRHCKPIGECDVLVIIDLKKNSLCDANERQLASLQQVYLQKKFQFSSSDPAYALVWPTGEKIIVRGNVFAGGVANVVNALQGYGISVR